LPEKGRRRFAVKCGNATRSSFVALDAAIEVLDERPSVRCSSLFGLLGLNSTPDPFLPTVFFPPLPLDVELLLLAPEFRRAFPLELVPVNRKLVLDGNLVTISFRTAETGRVTISDSNVHLSDVKLEEVSATFSAVRKLMGKRDYVEYKLAIDGDQKLKGKARRNFGGQKQ